MAQTETTVALTNFDDSVLIVIDLQQAFLKKIPILSPLGVLAITFNTSMVYMKLKEL